MCLGPKEPHIHTYKNHVSMKYIQEVDDKNKILSSDKSDQQDELTAWGICMGNYIERAEHEKSATENFFHAIYLHYNTVV